MFNLFVPLLVRILGSFMDRRAKNDALRQSYEAFATEFQRSWKSPAEVSDEFLRNRDEAQKPVEPPKP